MPQQQAQGTGQQKKFNWFNLILTIILIGGIGVLIFWFFHGFGSAKVVSVNELIVKIKKYSKAPDTGHFSKFQVDESASTIYITENSISAESSNKEKVESYEVHVPMTGLDYFTDATKQNGIYNDVINATQYRDSKGNLVNAYTGTKTSSGNSLFWNILISFLPLAIFIGFFIWMAKKQGGIGDALMSPGKNQARKIISKKRFSDIAGQAEAKEEIEEVVDFLKNPEKYRNAGARVPKGILLSGPPGTGKTLLAKATAGEARVPFFFISASNFVEMFAGVGAKRVREMFKDSRKSAPAILFIDELDAIGRSRGTSFSGNDEREQTLNQILVEMDGMEENTGLLIIAATNRFDVLDPALLRPGRFDRTISVNNPDIKEREAILKLHARGKRISPKIDFANIAKRTPGYSGAQLENVINEATLLSVREKTQVITLEQIDEAIDRVLSGPAKKHRTISPEELKMVAYHEAGHAVIGLKVAASLLVQKITIIPRGKSGGYNIMVPKKESFNYKKSELEAKIISLMGGRAAEQTIYGEGEVSTGASDDIEKSTAIARAMVTQFGMSDLGPIAYEKDNGPQYLGQERQKEYSDALAERIDVAVRSLILKAEEKAKKVIKANMKLLELIKDELLEKETIVLEEIKYINKNLKRPPKNLVQSEKNNNKSLEDIISEVKNKTVKNKKKAVKTKTSAVKKKPGAKKPKASQK